MIPKKTLSIFLASVSLASGAWDGWHPTAWTSTRLATDEVVRVSAVLNGPIVVTNWSAPFPSTNSTSTTNYFLSDIRALDGSTDAVVNVWTFRAFDQQGTSSAYRVTVTNTPTATNLHLQARDVCALDVYLAMQERYLTLIAGPVGLTIGTPEKPTFYRGNREALLAAKQWVAYHAGAFVTSSVPVYSTSTSAPIVECVGSPVGISGGVLPNYHTTNALLESIPAPSNYYAFTPYRNLFAHSNGWHEVRSILEQMRSVYYSDVPYLGRVVYSFKSFEGVNVDGPCVESFASCYGNPFDPYWANIAGAIPAVWTSNGMYESQAPSYSISGTATKQDYGYSISISAESRRMVSGNPALIANGFTFPATGNTAVVYAYDMTPDRQVATRYYRETYGRGPTILTEWPVRDSRFCDWSGVSYNETAYYTDFQPSYRGMYDLTPATSGTNQYLIAADYAPTMATGSASVDPTTPPFSEDGESAFIINGQSRDNYDAGTILIVNWGYSRR